jgi:membrane protein
LSSVQRAASATDASSKGAPALSSQREVLRHDRPTHAFERSERKNASRDSRQKTARARWSRWAKQAWELGEATVSGFSRDNGEILAAALAFYTLLSIAPLIIIAVAIAGLILGEGEAREEITRTLHDTMGGSAADSVNAWVDQARASGGVASALGLLLLLFGASRVTSQLRTALNQIWNVDGASEEGFRASVRSYVVRRLFAFAMVLASGPLLLGVFASRTALETLSGWLSTALPTAQPILVVLQPLLSFGVIACITAVVFKLVPDTRVEWRPAWVGATLTSVLFNAGNYLVAIYLARAGLTQTYGAAASVVVVLLWLYFSAQLFLLGAEFTQVYSERRGGRSRRELSW